jgi:hypothetical protein
VFQGEEQDGQKEASFIKDIYLKRGEAKKGKQKGHLLNVHHRQTMSKKVT